jgi:hypothetical protein
MIDHDPRSSGRHRIAALRNPHARKTRRAIDALSLKSTPGRR